METADYTQLHHKFYCFSFRKLLYFGNDLFFKLAFFKGNFRIIVATFQYC